jgi:hypothetical protein
MNSISDNDLILHYYRDGLDTEQLSAIDSALRASADLRARRKRLLDTLDVVDSLPVPEPAADFEARLWRALEPQISDAIHAQTEARHSKRPRPSLRALIASWLIPRPATAIASVIALAVAVGFLVGRQSATVPTYTADEGSAMATRMLDRYVAEHLRATEAVLVTAANSESVELNDGNRMLAASLVDANRLYASAAARQGNARLADFLRQIEPVLIELANQSSASSIQSSEGLRDYLRETDLLFEVRATEARIVAADERSL